MSLEDVEKINKLAKSLKDNGLAASMDDAIKAATSILGAKLPSQEMEKESITANEIHSTPVQADPENERNAAHNTGDSSSECQETLSMVIQEENPEDNSNVEEKNNTEAGDAVESFN